MTPRTRLATVALSLGLLLAACGSDSGANDSAGGGSPATDPAPGDGTAAAAAPDVDGDVCAAVPTVEEINAQLGEPVTAIARLERGPGTDLCEAAGDGVGNVHFSRIADSSRDQVVAAATALGYPPVDVNDPALPGAITYAGSVSVFVGDVEYTVQAITMDTISEPSSPAAVQRSAALLAMWLQNLGVAL